MPAATLVELFETLGEKSYRAKQVMQWLYQRHVTDFDAMTDLSALAAQRARERSRPPTYRRCSRRSIPPTARASGCSNVGAGQAVETVFIPEPSRGTLCISSQAGCALDCAFCATGHQGFNRNLTSAEILGQVVLASRELGSTPITNVVFMGMGEPLANYRNVLPVVQILLDDVAYGLSRRRVTISTAGVVPQIDKLATDCNVALAVSLHAPTDELRDRLVPINKIHPIAELLASCWRYAREYREPLDHVRIRAARRRERLRRAGAPARAAAQGAAGEGESDSVQQLPGVGVSLFDADARSTRSGVRCATPV